MGEEEKRTATQEMGETVVAECSEETKGRSHFAALVFFQHSTSRYRNMTEAFNPQTNRTEHDAAGPAILDWNRFLFPAPLSTSRSHECIPSLLLPNSPF